MNKGVHPFTITLEYTDYKEWLKYFSDISFGEYLLSLNFRFRSLMAITCSPEASSSTLRGISLTGTGPDDVTSTIEGKYRKDCQVLATIMKPNFQWPSDWPTEPVSGCGLELLVVTSCTPEEILVFKDAEEESSWIGCGDSKTELLSSLLLLSALLGPGDTDGDLFTSQVSPFGPIGPISPLFFDKKVKE